MDITLDCAAGMSWTEHGYLLLLSMACRSESPRLSLPAVQNPPWLCLFTTHTPKLGRAFIGLLCLAPGRLSVCWECQVLLGEMVSTRLCVNHATKCSCNRHGEALGTTTVLINGR